MPGDKPAYSITPDGEIRRLNQAIGRLDLDTGAISLDIDVAPVGMVHLKAQAFDLMMTRKNVPRGNPLIEVFKDEEKHEQAASLLGPFSREEFASSQPPPPPPQDPRFGDKTPAYMQWLGENFPDEFRKRYKGRKTHLTTGINPHLGRGDIPEAHFGKDAAEEWR